MKTTKCNFAVPGKESDGFVVFVETVIETSKIKELKKINKSTTIECEIKNIIKNIIHKWNETEEGKKFPKVTLEILGEILEDTYYNKYINLRKIIKENGFEKLRIRIVEISKEWKTDEILTDPEVVNNQYHSVDILADLLSRKA